MDIHELRQFESVYKPSKEVAFCWLRKQYVQLSTEENHTEIVDHANDSLRIWQAAKAQAVPEWILVEDELPKDGAKVLCYGRQFMCVGVFDGDDFFDPLDGQSFVKDCVTHWMQLPASPKAQEPAK